MCKAIREYYNKTGKKIGIKPAGGISDAETAILYYTIVKEILGEDWLNCRKIQNRCKQACKQLIGLYF